MADESKVVRLFSGDGDREAPIRTKPRDSAQPRPRECAHRRTEIDAGERRLYCRDCGELVEPFDFLLRLSEEDGRWRQARDAAHRAARQAQQRLDGLLLEEKRAKERLKRARDREQELNAKLTRLDAELRAFTPDPQPEET